MPTRVVNPQAARIRRYDDDDIALAAESVSASYSGSIAGSLGGSLDDSSGSSADEADVLTSSQVPRHAALQCQVYVLPFCVCLLQRRLPAMEVVAATASLCYRPVGLCKCPHNHAL